MTVIDRHLPPPFTERSQRSHVHLRLSPHRDRKVASCGVRFVPLGEVRMLRNRSLLMPRIFSKADEALARVQAERQRMLGDDWSIA